MPRRFLIAVAVAALVIGGGYAALALPFVWLPPQAGARLQVLWQDPGASVPRIAQTVAKPLSRALGNVEGVEEVAVTVSTGRVEIVVDFEARARNPLSRVRQQLARMVIPAGSEPIGVIQRSETPEIALLASTDQLGMVELTRWTLDVLLPALRGLKPVAAIRLEGAVGTEIIAIPDQRRLAGVGLSVEDIVRVLIEAQRGETEEARAPAAQMARLSALALRLPSGEVTALGEFARFDTRQTSPIEIRHDGAEALRITIRGIPATSEHALMEAVRSQLGWLQANGQLPHGLAVAPVEELRATRVQARRSLQRAMMIGALAALAFFFLITASLRALAGRAVLLLSTAGAASIVLWMTATPLSVPTLGGVALAIGPLLALSYIRRVQVRQAALAQPHHQVRIAVLGATIVLVPWLLASGQVADHYRSLLLVYIVVLGLGVLIDTLWSGGGRRRRVAATGWRSQSAAWITTIIERSQRVMQSRPWQAQLLLLGLLVGALLVTMTLKYRDVVLDVYRPLVIEWTPDSTGTGRLAQEDARLARLLAADAGVRHRELTYVDTSRTLDGRARIRARFGVEPTGDNPAWRARLLDRLSAAGLVGLRVAPDPEVPGANGMQVAVHSGEWSSALTLAGGVAEQARTLKGIARVDGGIEQSERYVLRADSPLAPEVSFPESQIERALVLAEGELLLGTWSHQTGQTALRMRIEPPPAPPWRVLLAGETRGTPARYLRDLGELVREPAPRWLQLDQDGYIVPLAIVPHPLADTQRLATDLARALDRIEIAPGEDVVVSSGDDIAIALGSAWQVALLATLSVMLLGAWGWLRGGAPRHVGVAAAVLPAVGVTLVTAAMSGVAGVGPSAPFIVGLFLVFGLSALQGVVLGADPGAARYRPFGRRALDGLVATMIMLAAVSPLATLSGAAGALLAPIAQVVSVGLLAGLIVNLLFLAAFPAMGYQRGSR